MVEVAIMIEGQNGLNWPRWQRLAEAAEGLEFAGLFRSDHFTNSREPDLDSLDVWPSLAWLASHTRRIEFGPLVTPFSFRHPVHVARQASAIDDLSQGRLVLGLGAGWQEREHQTFGFSLLDVERRVKRFDEGVQVVRRLLQSDEPVSFDGEFYQLREARLLPRPQRPGGPPILIGGNGPRRTLPLVAQHASEWNASFIPVTQFADLNRRLTELLQAAGRDPAGVRRSLMTGTIFGRDEAEVGRKSGARTPDEQRARGMVCGTPNQVVEQLGRLAEAGAQRVMLQWLDLDDLDSLERLAKTVLPQVQPR